MKLKYIILSLSFFIAQTTQTHIIEIHSMDEAHDILAMAHEKTLVLYDVDETLIYPTDKIHQPKFYLADPIRLMKEAFARNAGDRVEHLWSKVLRTAERVLVEPTVVHTIKSLQEIGVMVLGFTKMRDNAYGTIDSLAQYRFEQLRNLGIDFQQSFKETRAFKQCTSFFNTWPIVYKGIIFSSEASKGEVLGAFLDCLESLPTLIIFFDDVLENHLAIQEELYKRAIPYYGFYYRAVEQIPGKADYKLAQFQLDYLTRHEVWLSDAQARVLMNEQR